MVELFSTWWEPSPTDIMLGVRWDAVSCGLNVIEVALKCSAIFIIFQVASALPGRYETCNARGGLLVQTTFPWEIKAIIFPWSYDIAVWLPSISIEMD